MNYKEVPFNDLLEAIIDNRGRTCPVQEKGIPLIATNCIKDNTLYPVFEKVRYVSQETYDTWFRGHPKPEDIIFVLKGSPGRVNWVPDPINFCIAQDMVAIRANQDIVDPKYLFALLKSKSVRSKIENMHVGSLIPHFKKGDFDKLLISVPENLEYQRKIGKIYFDFYNKIELNRKMNETLETIAQTLFKSWFVDFDPVHSKAKCSSDEELETAAKELGISKEILELFPSEFEESLLGMIPKGWTVKAISEISTVNIGKTPPRKESHWFSNKPSDIKWVSIKDMGNSGVYLVETSEYLTTEAIERFNVKVIPENTVLLSFKLTVGRVSITTEKMTTNEAIAHFNINKKSILSPEYIYCYLKQFDYNQLGSTSSIATAINSKIVKSIPVLLASDILINKFNNLIQPMFEKILANTLEIQTLQKTRDTLLPKLLSGEIDVSKLTLDINSTENKDPKHIFDIYKEKFGEPFDIYGLYWDDMDKQVDLAIQCIEEDKAIWDILSKEELELIEEAKQGNIVF